MRKGPVIALVVFLAVLAISSTITTSLAADYSRVGVREGQQIDYSIKYYGQSPSIPESEYLRDYTNVHIDVLGVVGTNVSFYLTYFFFDQTKQTESLSADVSIQGCYYLTVVGLKIGDPIYIGAQVTVKDTILMTILGAPRLVNVVELSTALDATITLYYDKETGILVEQYRSSLMFGWMVWRITDEYELSTTNPGGFILGIGTTAIIIIAVAVTAISPARKIASETA